MILSLQVLVTGTGRDPTEGPTESNRLWNGVTNNIRGRRTFIPIVDKTSRNSI